jgi:carotenoid cleavage dioxygenase-like enzyme
MKGEYVEGVLEPVSDELDLENLAVEGELPAGLRGSYLRNGPNPAFQPKAGYHVWDGDGMIHAMTFGDAGVSYRNRWVNTEGLALERKAGRALFGGINNREDPPPELAGNHGALKNIANTNIVRHCGRYLALWEAGRPTVLTNELDAVGTDDFAGKLTGPMTAHPKIDPESGEMLFFGYAPFPPYLRYHEVNAQGKLERSIDIDLPGPVMIHDFAVSSEHVIFFDCPAAFDLEAFVAGDQMIKWKPELGSRVGVMRRGGDGSDLRWFEIDPCYVFHTVNAWTNGSTVTVLGASSDWLLIDYKHDVAPDGVDHSGYLTEFTIDLAAGTCHKQRIGELPGEFGKIPDSLAGLETRYSYLSSYSTGIEEGISFDSMTKYDRKTGEQTLYAFGPGETCGECAFAPDPNGSAEDDGWLVNWVYGPDGRTSEFVVIDARDITSGPIARIPMPRRVPFGFHANWFAPGS